MNYSTLNPEDRILIQKAAAFACATSLPIIDTLAGPQILERRDPDGTECYRAWNPLFDTVDSFNLALLLGFPLDLDLAEYCDREEWEIDPAAATKRAIVEAAANR